MAQPPLSTTAALATTPAAANATVSAVNATAPAPVDNAQQGAHDGGGGIVGSGRREPNAASGETIVLYDLVRLTPTDVNAGNAEDKHRQHFTYPYRRRNRLAHISRNSTEEM